MRIVIFTQYFPPEVGATQTRMDCFARTLASRDHSVTVVTEVPNHPSGIVASPYRRRLLARDRSSGIDVVRVWVLASPRKTPLRRIAFYGSYMVVAFLAAVLLVRGRVDAVLSTSPPLLVPVAGWLFSRFKRCPHILDVRDLWPEAGVAVGELRPGLLERVMRALAHFLYRRSRLVTVTTRSFMKTVTLAGVHPSRVAFLPNGTLPELFRPEAEDPKLRRELGLEGKFIVTYAGLHGVAQSLQTILDAASLLSNDPDVVFLLIGEGPVKTDLVRAATERHLENVRFVQEVPIDQAPRYLATSDALLVPLRAGEVFHGFIPSKLFDCMAVGRPVILSVNGEAREILEDAAGGLFAEPGSADALVEAVRRLRANREESRAMGERGRRYVLSHFVRATQAEQLERMLAEIVQGAGPGR